METCFCTSIILVLGDSIFQEIPSYIVVDHHSALYVHVKELDVDGKVNSYGYNNHVIARIKLAIRFTPL